MRNPVLCVFVTCLAFVFSACANFSAVDKPLLQWTPQVDRDVWEQAADNRSGGLLVLVAFSGGGTRAASFSYGVLQELTATKIMTEKGERTLAHEIDMISSVSGGSFTAAYYGLYGDRIFEEFEARFLRRDVEGVLIGKLFNPVNWLRLFSPQYGMADMASDYYSKTLFDGATFSGFRRPGAPLVVINATDLPNGVRIPFTPLVFDLICADLASYPVSRAVAASSAVPVIFTPITVKSYAGTCGYEPPAWKAEALKDKILTTRKHEAQALVGYLDRETRPWLHLVDGGIADNLGLRSFYNFVDLVGDPRSAFRALNHPGVRHILIISVNAHVKKRELWPLKRSSPPLAAVLGNISSDQIDRYSLDTLNIVRNAYNGWAEQLSTPQHPVSFNFVEVSIDAVRDEAERQYLNNVGTNFNLENEQVDRLISAARQVLRESPEFKAFLDGSRDRGSGSKSPDDTRK